jgi:hypothetical protein
LYLCICMYIYIYIHTHIYIYIYIIHSKALITDQLASFSIMKHTHVGTTWIGHWLGTHGRGGTHGHSHTHGHGDTHGHSHTHGGFVVVEIKLAWAWAWAWWSRNVYLASKVLNIPAVSLRNPGYCLCIVSSSIKFGWSVLLKIGLRERERERVMVESSHCSHCF